MIPIIIGFALTIFEWIVIARSSLTWAQEHHEGLYDLVMLWITLFSYILDRKSFGWTGRAVFLVWFARISFEHRDLRYATDVMIPSIYFRPSPSYAPHTFIYGHFHGRIPQ